MKITNRLTLLKWLLLVFGLLDAVYLTYIKFSTENAMCLSGCDVVNHSAYSEILGIPVAILGALYYVVQMAVLIVQMKKPEFTSRLQMAAFGISLFGFLFSLYLTYVEIFILNAICQYCVISAVIVTIYLVINLVEVLKQPLEPGG